MAHRREKIEEQIKRLLSELLIKEIKDPRIGFATLTGVQLNRDMSIGRVGVSVLGTPRDLRKTLEGLNSARNYMQIRISKALHMRTAPRIVFYPDSSVSEGVRMVNIIDGLVTNETETEKENGENGQYKPEQGDKTGV